MSGPAVVSAVPSELECLLSQIVRDGATALRALDALRASSLVHDMDRGLIQQATWAVTATQFNVARVAQILKEEQKA